MAFGVLIVSTFFGMLISVSKGQAIAARQSHILKIAVTNSGDHVGSNGVP